MVNLHISLTPFKNESRVIKQTNSLIKYRVFEKIYILALHEEGLAIKENLNPQIEVNRVVLRTRAWSKNLLSQLIKYVELSIIILKFAVQVRPKVVNIHGLPLLPLGSFIKLLTGARLIYDTHELETETEGLTSFRQKLAKVLESVFIRFTNAIVVVGNEIRNWYIKAYKCKNIITVLNCPNYIQPEQSNLIRSEFGIEQDRKIILYLGGISEGRGIRYLLEAFSALAIQRYALVFIGYGDLEELVIEYSIKNKHIYLRSAVRPPEVIKYAASADIGVSIIEDNCLSYTFCLPNKLFEYTMAGIPTIISDLPEMKRVIDAYQIGIAIPADSISEFEIALQYISEIPVDEMAQNLNKAAQELNWENQEKLYIDLVKDLINK